MGQPPPAISDADLLASYLADRDEQAFARLMARHHETVARRAVRLTGNHAGAEDVTQATFLVLARRARPALRVARRRRSVLPWLNTTCRHVASNWHRSRKRRHHHESRAARDPVAVDLSRPTELAEMVTVAMSGLRRRDRQLIELRHLDELPWNEGAARLKTTPDAARKACDGALSKLRTALGRHGVTVMPAVLVSTLAFLTKPTKAAAPTPAAFSLATGVITMMKLKTAGVTAALLLASSAALVPVLAQDGGAASSDAPATRSLAKQNDQDSLASALLSTKVQGGYTLQVVSVEPSKQQGYGEAGDSSVYRVTVRLLAPGVSSDEPVAKATTRLLAEPVSQLAIASPEGDQKQAVTEFLTESESLLLSFGTGEWKSFGEYNGRGTLAQGAIYAETHFIPEPAEDNELKLRFVTTHIAAPHRAVAVDKDGTVHLPTSNTYVATQSMATHQMRFAIDADELDHFSLDFREPAQAMVFLPLPGSDSDGAIQPLSSFDMKRDVDWGDWPTKSVVSDANANQ